MKLYDTCPMTGDSELAYFEGGKYALGMDEITRSFRKAKRMVVDRLKEEIADIQREIDTIEAMLEEEVPESHNPYY